MILSDGDIRRRLEAGDLVIEPLEDPELQIQPASVDFRLGREFLEFERTNISSIHPDRGDEVEQYVTRTRVPADDEEDQATLEGFDDGPEPTRVNDEFILHPGDFVLGTTMERVEIPNDLIAHVEGRSSLGRLAIVVHASLPFEEQVFLWTPGDGFGFHRIGDVVEDRTPARAVAFDPETLRVRTHAVTDYITNPAQRIYRVRLESGREVQVTKDHNLFTIDEQGEVVRVASEDAEGRRVMVPASLPTPTAPETELDLLELFEDCDELVAYATDGVAPGDWTDAVGRSDQRHAVTEGRGPSMDDQSAIPPSDIELESDRSDGRLPRRLAVGSELGWILGFYIVAGAARRDRLRFVSTDRKLLDRAAAWFTRYDIDVTWAEHSTGADALIVRSVVCSELFRTLAGAGAERNVPDRAWNWDDDTLAALLEGLLDGDGTPRESRDTLYTSNPDLADRAMYLAGRLELVNSASSEGGGTSCWPDVWTEGEGEWAVDIAGRARTQGPSVPTPSGLLGSLREQAGLGPGDVADLAGHGSKSRLTNLEERHYDGVSRSVLRRLRDVYDGAGVETSRLDRLLEGDVRFERVVSVEATDRVETTYDLEVQPTGRRIENFIGGHGGVFLSNTAGIVDPGYRGQITLELSNLGNAPVALKPGMRISQLTFTELKTPAERPYGADRGSKYQDQTGPQASRIQGDDEFRADR